MTADSKEATGLPLIFKSKDRFIFTEKSGDMAIRQGGVAGALSVDFRNFNSIRIAFIGGKWRDFFGLTATELTAFTAEQTAFTKQTALILKKPLTCEEQAQRVCELFAFLRRDPIYAEPLKKLALPSAADAITEPHLQQFQHFKYELYQAIQSSDLSGITKLIDANASPDIMRTMEMNISSKKDDYWSRVSPPLGAAIKNGSSDVVALLLEKSAALTGRHDSWQFEWSALNVAIYNTNFPITQQLIAAKANPNSQDGTTVLQEACQVRDVNADFVKVLLQEKADPNLVGSINPDSPILLAIKNVKPSSEAIKLLLEAKADFNPDKFSGELEKAAGHNPHIIPTLVEAKADARLLSVALGAAVIQNKPEIVLELIALKADINAKHFADQTPLHHAVKKENFVLIKLLLKTKARILPDSTGLTPLQLIPFDRRTEYEHQGILELFRIAMCRQRGLAFLAGTHKRQKPEMTVAVDHPLYRATRSGLFDRQVLRIPLAMSGVETTKKNRY